MTIFYIQSESEGVLELTTTVDINVTEPSTITRYRMESGSTVTDNVVNGNLQISFDGLISQVVRIIEGQVGGSISNLAGELREQQVVQNSSQRTVQDYITALRRLKDSRELFRVHYDDRLPVADNCLMKNVSFDRNPQTGQAYNVSIQFEQVRLSQGASFTELPVQRNPDLNEGETTTSDNSTVDGTVPTRTLGLSIGEDIFNSVLGG